MELMKTKKTPKSVSQTMLQACDVFNVFQIIKREKKKSQDVSSLKKIISAAVFNRG